MNQYQVTIRERGVYSFTLRLEDSDMFSALQNTKDRFGYQDDEASFLIFSVD